MSPQSSSASGNARALPERLHPVLGNKIVALRLVGGALALWGLLSLLGLLATHVLVSGRGESMDRGVNVWFVAHRTDYWNSVTSYANDLANTQTVIAVTLVLALLLRWRLGRWYESWVIIAVMTGEVLVFLAVTLTVHRDRPAVVRLDKSPPTSSFPSGHTAAAIALYGSIAILLLWIYGRSWKTQTATVVLFCVPIVVGLSRLYRGMHYPSDVLAGALGGGLWLFIVISTLLPRRGSTNQPTNTR